MLIIVSLLSVISHTGKYLAPPEKETDCTETFRFPTIFYKLLLKNI